MAVIPGVAVAAAPATMHLAVTPELIHAFATLTGDRSHLHVDSEFARRSAYRRAVAHGMLPVACLAKHPAFDVAGYCCRIRGLTGRFASPVFPGDALTLSTGQARMEADESVVLDYRITNNATRTVVTAGTLTLFYEPGAPSTHSAAAASSGTLVHRSPTVNNLTLEEIEVGAVDDLDFVVTEETLGALSALLHEGVTAGGTFVSAGADHLPTLTAILLYSTSIGVSLPGASATFLEFSARVEKAIEVGKPYRLKGRVAHRSTATRIIKKELLVTPAGSESVSIRGKASTLVTKPFERMPSSEELRATVLDLGLRNKVVLITGASRGIGETTAKLFALHGAKVIVNYHRGGGDASRVVGEIIGAGGDALAIQADVSDAAAVRAMVATARNRYGTIDVLVNNAARDFRPTPFLQLTWDEIQKDIDVIAKGAFHCCREVLPLMLEQGGGRIINISTVATDNPPADQTKYVMAKSALVGLTRSLSIEFAAKNIQVNMVVPNFVETDLVAHIQEGFRKKIAQDIPMRRVASSVDVARAVVTLASSLSSFTTGQKIMVTGGGPPYL